MTGDLSVFTSNRALAKIYYIKWKIQDAESLTDAPLAEVTLKLKVTHYCHSNMITAVKDALQHQNYYLGNDALTLSPSSGFTTTRAVETCPLRYSYFVKHTSTGNWVLQTSNVHPFSAFDSTTGELNVFTLD